jgi:hypothetical protein
MMSYNMDSDDSAYKIENYDAGGKGMYCAKCGNELKDGAQFCSACGEPQTVRNGGEMSAPPTQSYESVESAPPEKTITAPAAMAAPQQEQNRTPADMAVPQKEQNRTTAYMTTPHATTPSPKKKRKLPLIIAGSTGGAVLVALLVVFLVIPLFFGDGSVETDENSSKSENEKGGVYYVLEAKTDVEGDKLEAMMNNIQSIIEWRVNELGFSEAVVTIEGDNRICIELPDMDNADQTIKSVGRVAQLKILLADGTEALNIAACISNSKVVPNSNKMGYLIILELTSDGANQFYEATSKAASGAISRDEILKDADGNTATDRSGSPVQPNSIVIMLDNEIISAPTASMPLEGNEIGFTGAFTLDEANELSVLIRSGALPVAMVEVESGHL